MINTGVPGSGYEIIHNNYDSNKLIHGTMTSRVGTTYPKSRNHDKKSKCLRNSQQPVFSCNFVLPGNSSLMMIFCVITAGILAKVHAIITRV